MSTTPMTRTDASSVAVVTIARDRRDHLARQRAWLRRNAPGVDHVIVDMGGASIDDGPGTVVRMDVPDGDPLPLSAARNLGARSTDAAVIVFLDVDCLPTRLLVPSYVRQVERYGGVWSGPVGYLPPAEQIDDWSVDALTRVARFQSGRPEPGQTPRVIESPDMFWSLSFAISRDDWDAVGGFDERYRGYGGEDTDFARTLVHHGVHLFSDGHALAFHQHHPVSSPPFEHLDDIVVNATVFHDKWREWPMSGWLSAFREADLIDWHPDADRIAVTRS